MLLTSICLILSLLVAFSPGAVLFASPPPLEESGGSVMKATGRGMPRSNRRDPQARLLAKRAATVRAYRNLLSRVGETPGCLEGGTGSTSTDGFIRGAYIDEIRYYPDGTVEVVVGLNVKTKGGMEPRAVGAGEAVPQEEYVSERPGTVITEKEWESLQAEME